MTVLITMAGFGSRFQAAGYDVPKYAIDVKGRTLFEWSLSSLDRFGGAEPFVFVVRAADKAAPFIERHCAALGIAKPVVVELDAPTDGQATSALIGMDACDANAPVTIYNIDTYVEPAFIEKPRSGLDGYIPCFAATGTHWSFVRLNAAGKAVEVREKKRISDYATIGLYWFKNPAIFRSAYEERYRKQRALESNEAYIAPLFNNLIAQGLNVGISVVPSERVHALGTPAEVEAFIKDDRVAAFGRIS